MSDQTKNREEMLRAAVEGDSDALGELLGSHRPYLKILAERYLDDRLQQRVSGSDLIQQTCVSAVRFIASFKGQSEAEFAAWLRTILERHAFDTFREHLAEKRDMNRERSLGDASSQEAFLVDLNMSSPSRRLLRGETAVELAICGSRGDDVGMEAAVRVWAVSTFGTTRCRGYGISVPRLRHSFGAKRCDQNSPAEISTRLRNAFAF